MMNPLLKHELQSVFRRRERMHLALRLALCWTGLAVLGFAALVLQPSPSPLWLPGLALVAVLAGVLLFLRHRRVKPDWKAIARVIERRHPELNGILLTAVEQEPANDGHLHYLQQRVLRETLLHSHTHFWPGSVPWFRSAGSHCLHLLTLLLFLGVLIALKSPAHRGGGLATLRTAEGVEVTPGDTEIERGERLVVIASFQGFLPAQVDLVTRSGSAAEQRTPLVKSLSDPVFGGSISGVETDLVYRVEYGGDQTRDFNVKVFEYPRLERSDAEVRYPTYTGLEPKHIEATRRISAVEGSQCDWTLTLNKPVAEARFIAEGNPDQSVTLTLASNSPVATLARLVLETNATYLLQLIDYEGRTNKAQARFVLNALKNRDPELKIASPRGDTRPSALEEMVFEGTVWDDFGIQAYGLAYAEAGGDIHFVELGQQVPAGEKRPFKHLLRLEDLGAKPDQLLTWFLWADDIGPDGEVRRTAGDLYFAEVRPFDEVFRQGQGGGGEQQGGGQSGAGAGAGGSPQTQLTELQKQIINATWKLQRQQSRRTTVAPSREKATDPNPAEPEGNQSRTTAPAVEDPFASRPALLSRLVLPRSAARVFGQPAPGSPPASPLIQARDDLARLASTNKTASSSQYIQDLTVVRDAVAQAISQARETRAEQTGIREAGLWDELIRELEKARTELDKAVASPPSLADALAAEQAAFQVLLKLQQREYEVSRNRNRSQNSQSNQSSREQQLQRQLDELDLTQPENRYETERLAETPQTQERREQLQVMNRLAELARRQQDLNERLAELQTALQEAQTEQEREAIQRELKRLQEEEQRMLSDVDELQQRMDQPQNQSAMNEQRQQLDQTRQDMQRAAEATQQGSVSQALASGTRAQRQLEQMREQMRRESAGEFAEDLKQLRNDAREAERRQQALQSRMEATAGNDRKQLDDSQERQRTLQELADQAQRLTNLVSRATELSQQTEEAEPLASRELYDTLRKFSQEDADSVRRLQDELIENGLVRTELYQRLKQLEQGDGAKAVELTAEMLRQGLLPQAEQAGQRASTAVSDLREGIERAAEKVLGDDTEALRLAQQQLEQLTEQIEREIAQGQNPDATNRQAAAGGQAQANAPSQPGAPTESSTPSSAGQPTGANEEGREGQAQTREPGSDEPQPGEAQQAARSGQTPGPRQTPTGGRSQAAQAGRNSQPQDGERSAEEEQLAQAGGQPQGGNPGEPAAQPNRGSRQGSPRQADNPGSLRGQLEQFLDSGRGGSGGGPVITGEDFVQWSDGLREVEEMVEDPALQNQLAAARDRARVLRQEFRRTNEIPEWAEVQSQVVRPLVEVRNEIANELARRSSRENLVPIDRDPVPGRFSEMVRRYYEELGKDK